MATLKEEAMAYEPKEYKNIADLEKVPISAITYEKQKTDSEGKEFEYKYISFNDEEYRVPKSVLKQLKIHCEVNGNLQFFRVVKKGTGFDTEYTVIPLP